MAQNNNVAKTGNRFFKTDFIALKYYLSGLSDSLAFDKLYSGDYVQRLTGVTDLASMRERLTRLRDHLASIALNKNPHIAHLIADARKRGQWGKSVVNFLMEQSYDLDASVKADDGLVVWLKPLICTSLLAEDITTVSDLKQYIEQRGRGWWRPIPRLGKLKALAIEKWLQEQSAEIGEINWPQENSISTAKFTVLQAQNNQLVPLDNVGSVVNHLDGSVGKNRAHKFSLIQANNDLQAIEAYLYRYRDSQLTYRSYKKELERFLLWCVCQQNVALSSVLVNECEQYKNFLNNIPGTWIGGTVSRKSSNWKPFSGQLSVISQAYAIRAIRAFFQWLVDVRYLAANPWKVVSDPKVPKSLNPMQIERALPADTWDALYKEGGILDQAVLLAQSDKGKGAYMREIQMRIARAAIILIGSTGLRLQEAATATLNNLRPVVNQGIQPTLYELDVLGKRNKWRQVYLPTRAINVLKEHLKDRGIDTAELGSTTREVPLLAPIYLIHGNGSSADSEFVANTPGYSARALSRVITTNLKWISNNHDLDLSSDMAQSIFEVSPHDLRHTFATLTTGDENNPLPLDVVQKLLGHASLQTTSIYVHAERKRSIRSVGQYFS